MKIDWRRMEEYSDAIYKGKHCINASNKRWKIISTSHMSHFVSAMYVSLILNLDVKANYWKDSTGSEENVVVSVEFFRPQTEHEESFCVAQESAKYYKKLTIWDNIKLFFGVLHG